MPQKKRNKTTQLPRSLNRLVSEPVTGGVKKKTKKKHVKTRKELRKESRNNKKADKAKNYYNFNSKKSNNDSGKTQNAKNTKDNNKTQNTKTTKKQNNKKSEKKNITKTKATKKDDKINNERELEEKRKEQVRQVTEELYADLTTEDDKIINQMERRLGLRSKKKKNIGDGFDDILDGLLNKKKNNSAEKDKSNEPNNEMLGESDDDENIYGDSDDENMLGDSDDENMLGESEDESIPVDSGENMLGESGDENNIEGSGDDEKILEDSESIEEMEDMYGKKKVESKKENTDSIATKYVPPHMRKNNNDYELVKRQIRGNVNKLTKETMMIVFSEIENIMFTKNKADALEIFCDLIISNCCDPKMQMAQILILYAGLITSLHLCFGLELGGKFIDLLAKKLDLNLSEVRNSPNPDAELVCVNLVQLLSHLYTLEVVHCTVIYGLAENLIESFKEIDIELLLSILKNCGFQLRADDPIALRDIIVSVFEQSKKANLNVDMKIFGKKVEIHGNVESNKTEASFSKRIEYMLETILQIKNNRMGEKFALLKQESESMKKKIEKYFSENKKDAVRDIIKINWKDLTDPKSKGRWWMVGSAFAGPSERELNEKRELVQNLGQTDPELLKLARTHKMTTDSQRSIFISLLSSEDYLEAFEKLMRLNLRSMQERDIVIVLIYCCQQEPNFNPYYGHLATKLCSFNKSYRFTFKMQLYDKMSSFQDENMKPKPNAIVNTAKLLVHLLQNKDLHLNIFKPMDSARLTINSLLFFKTIFNQIFTTFPNIEEFFSQFNSITQNKLKDQLREQISSFLLLYQKNLSRENNNPDKEKILHGIEIGLKQLKEKESFNRDFE